LTLGSLSRRCKFHNSHLTAQRRLPITLIGAGLPQLRGRMGKAKSYAERLFDFPEVGPLPAEAARIAIVLPATALGVTIDEDAVLRIVDETKGYPYFLQEWGKHAWNAAARSPITRTDVRAASTAAVAALDESFFRVLRASDHRERLDRSIVNTWIGPS